MEELHNWVHQTSGSQSWLHIKVNWRFVCVCVCVCFKSQCQGCTASQLDQDPWGMEPGFSPFKCSSSDSNMSKIENHCIEFHCWANPFFLPPFFPVSSSGLFFLLSVSLSLSLIVVYYFHCMIFNKKRHKVMVMLWLSVDSAVWGTKAALLYP